MNTTLPLLDLPTLDERLATDPYDLRSLVERMLTAMSEQDIPAAQKDFQLLRRVRGKCASFALLDQAVFANGRTITARNPVFFLGPIVPSETFLRDIADAVDACATLLAATPPVILVNCVERQQSLFLTHREFPGFAVVTISTHSPRYPDRLRRTLFHEVAHCFLACGSRVLDEGFAVWFAENHSGVPTRKAPRDPNLPADSLRTLLLASGKEGVLFETSGLDADELPSVRRLAVDLIDELIGRNQLIGVQSLFERVQEASSAEEIVRLVEDALGRRLEQFQPPAAAAAEPAGPSDDELGVQAARALMKGWADRDRPVLAEMVKTLEARPQRTAKIVDALANLRITDAAVAIAGGGKPEDAALKTIDALLSEASSAGLTPGRLFLLRAKRADIAAQLAGANVIKMVNASQQALHWYSKAMRENSRDPDLLIHFGIHEAHVPAQFGGGREKALAFIRQAVDDPLWGEWAKRLIADFDTDIEKAAEKLGEKFAATNGAPKPAAPVPPPKPIAIEVKGLKARINAEFELTPADFTIHAGERVALVGHNGAGKSVLIETLLALRRPGEGTISLLGRDAREFQDKAELRLMVGASLQKINFAALIRVGEIVRTHEIVYKTKNPVLAVTLGLDEMMMRPYRTLSKGMKQRVKLFLALAHRPKVALLDEPSVGLDERYARALRDYLTGPDMKECAVLIASHVSADIAISHRVICLAKGKTLDTGSIQSLIERHVGRRCAHIRQPLSDACQADLAKIEGILRPPLATESGTTVYGRDDFDRKFISFLERHAISSFSLEPSSTEDFLAHIAQDSK